jgi:transposase
MRMTQIIVRNDKMSEEDKMRIVVYYKDGLCINEIANKLNRNRHTISLYINRYIEHGHYGLKRIEGTGKIKNKNKKDNTNTTQSIITLLYEYKFLTITEMKVKLEQINNIQISSYLLRKTLLEHGFEYGFPPKRQSIPLTEEIKASLKRLQFAVRYKKFDWKNVLFTDECAVWKNKKTIKLTDGLRSILN